MLGVNIVFMFVAAVAFFGFLINVLFDRLRITNVLPLMLIGLLVGPILKLVNTSATSTVSVFTPYITAVAVAFILFDVGLNVDIFRLSKILARATEFTFAASTASAFALAAGAIMLLHWSILEALIFGFALAGPSSVIVPTLVKMTKAPPDLKTALVYEGVITDSIQLVIPLLLFQLLMSVHITTLGAVSLFASVILGSILLGALLAFVLLYVLKKFSEYSKDYDWMLTITMVIATYGISQQFGLSGALTIFVFGIMFANVGKNVFRIDPASKEPHSGLHKYFGIFVDKYFALPAEKSVTAYQREIVFFTSTFFFVYIGLLFNVSDLSPLLLVNAAALTAVIMLIRYVCVPLLREFVPKQDPGKQVMRRIVSFDISRGLSSAIVATLPLAFGIVIPGFLDQIFLIILFTNIASTAGVFLTFRSPEAQETLAPPPAKAASPKAPAKKEAPKKESAKKGASSHK